MIAKRWASIKSHSPLFKVPNLRKSAVLRMGCTCPSIIKLSDCRPFVEVLRISKSAMPFKSTLCVRGAIVTIGYVIFRQMSGLERTTQKRPFSWNFLSLSGISGITTSSSSTRHTSPVENERREAPALSSADRKSIRCYLPAFCRSGRQSSKVRSWRSSRSLSLPFSERSTGNSRNSSNLVRGRGLDTVAISMCLRFLESCDMRVYRSRQDFGGAILDYSECIGCFFSAEGYRGQSTILGRFRKLFVFKVFGFKHLHERVPEKEFVLSVVKAVGHLLEIGR